MKKFELWFNQLPPAQQKKRFVLYCVLFAGLLTLSICYQQLSMNTGNIIQPRIKIDTLKHR